MYFKNELVGFWNTRGQLTEGKINQIIVNKNGVQVSCRIKCGCKDCQFEDKYHKGDFNNYHWVNLNNVISHRGNERGHVVKRPCEFDGVFIHNKESRLIPLTPALALALYGDNLSDLRKQELKNTIMKGIGL